MGVQRQSPRVSRRRTCGRRGVTTRHGPMQRIPAPARRRREVRPPWGRSSVVFLSAGALRLPAVIESATPMGSAASLSVRCRSARTTSPPPPPPEPDGERGVAGGFRRRAGLRRAAPWGGFLLPWDGSPIAWDGSADAWGVSARSVGGFRGPMLAAWPCFAMSGEQCGRHLSAPRRRGRAVRVAAGRRPLCLASRALSPFFGKSPPSPPCLPCIAGVARRGSAAPRGRSVRFFKKNGRARQRFRKIT